MLNTYTVPWLFVARIQKRNCYLSVTTLTSKNITCAWFIVCFHLNMFFLPFSVILTWKCINHTYFVWRYTLNTPNTPYFFVYNREKRLHFMLLFCLQNINRTFLLTSKLVNMSRSILFVVCYLQNTLFLVFFAV